MPKKENSTPPGIGQYFTAGAFAALALGAGGVSMAMNYSFGLKAGAVAAFVLVLSDCAKILLPMVDAALGGTTAKRKLTYVAAAAVSIISATVCILEMQTTRILSAQHQAATVAGASADMSAARQALEKISETADVAALEIMSAEAAAKAEREAARGGCGKLCEAAKAERVATAERLGQAKRRDELKAELEAAKAVAAETPVEASGASDSLAKLTGADKGTLGAGEAILFAVVLLVICELLAAFSGDAAQLLIATRAARRAAIQTPKRAAEPAQAAEAVTVARDKQAETLLRLQMMILHSPDGHLLAPSRRKLADTLGVAKSTLDDWLKKWQAAGEIKIAQHGRRSLLTAPKAKAA